LATSRWSDEHHHLPVLDPQVEVGDSLRAAVVDLRDLVEFDLRHRSALDRSAEAGATEEGPLEDEEGPDRDEASDEHRGEEDAERRLQLDRGQAERKRLLVRVRDDE